MRSQGAAGATPREAGLSQGAGRAFPLDATVGPALLVLLARELVLYDPPRVLAWRLLHDSRVAALPAWLAWAMPRPHPDVDRDPIAMALAALAVFLAIAWLVAGIARVRVAWRAGLLAVAAVVLVLLPSVAFVAMGVATGRPYGQDGGVVQLPLAIEKVLVGETPYGADYADSILGRQARVSDFWARWGGNPILHHHAYLPGTHVAMLPAYLGSRALGVPFDPRSVTLAALLAARVAGGGERGLTAAAVVLLNPFAWWAQVFGANDILPAAWLLAAALAAQRGRPTRAAALAGVACATKQLAWPFAPFLLLALSGAGSLRELASWPVMRRLAGLSAVAAVVAVAIVAPVAALDPAAMWRDIVLYNAGLPGVDAYPLGGTPGFGLANVLIYTGVVSSLRDQVALGWAYLLLVPLGFVLLRVQVLASSRRRDGNEAGGPGGGGSGVATALAAGSVALLASLYLSRVVHGNYTILAALLLPVALLAGARGAVDVVLGPLALLATAIEVSSQEVLRTTWEDAVAARLPERLDGIARALAPKAGPHLTLDPLGLAWSAAAAGLGVVLLAVGVGGAPARVRIGLLAAAMAVVVVVPTCVVVDVGRVSGAPRVEDDWGATTLRAAGSARSVEAWSVSFRSDPPRTITTEGEASWLQRLLGRVTRDPRPWTLLALVAVAVAALTWRAVPEAPPATLALLLAPPLALGAVFGSGEPWLLAGLLVAGRARGFVAGLGAGLLATAFPHAIFAAPFLVRCRWAAAGLAAGLALGSATGSAAPLLHALGGADIIGPGVGLANLALYRGQIAPGFFQHVAPLVLLGAAVWAGRRVAVGSREAVEGGRLAGIVTALLAGLAVAPRASPHALATPLILLLMLGLAHAPRTEGRA